VTGKPWTRDRVIASRGGCRVLDRERLARADHVADPALGALQDGQPAGDIGVQTCPGRDRELVALEQPEHRDVDTECALRLPHDHPQELGPIVGRGEPLRDLEDRLEVRRQLLCRVGGERRDDALGKPSAEP
jgi:hypothetical protein